MFVRPLYKYDQRENIESWGCYYRYTCTGIYTQHTNTMAIGHEMVSLSEKNPIFIFHISKAICTFVKHIKGFILDLKTVYNYTVHKK